ncbi:Gfo/Idh/MocA family oxidoreductase [Alteromonas sp. ASW11-130]|uniref:Gfo/Idh/MocA family oxidoreductase n=1 Tax=Alteromonas sp. ASW11-130 TaxID=3015775 RepID=UPI0022418A1F|nr:Gfo/Idh/MocA family oxidoreductase [Alteromonas sp. ASW11-130]MCW8093223.1 Gfo/Idh/MocA family oxidoreductase [Alteromonas sp. ASW11-130]
MVIETLLVGFGYAATTFHLPFLQTLNEFEISGVVSSDAGKVHTLLPECRVYASLDEALVSQSFNLVVVTTPNQLHSSQAKKALLAKSHVLVEKPFTLSVSEASELFGLAEHNKLALCAFHNRRFDGDFLSVSKLIENKKLGDIKRITSRFDRFRPQPKDRWRESTEKGSGIFWDLGPHLIDQAIALFGKPVSVSGYLQILRENSKAVDNFELTLHYEGLNYHVGSSPFQANETLRFELQGTKASYRQFGLDPQEEQLKRGTSPSEQRFGLGANEGQLCTLDKCEAVAIEAGQYVQFYSRVAQSILGSQPPPISADEILTTIKILASVAEAAEANHGHVSLNL